MAPSHALQSKGLPLSFPSSLQLHFHWECPPPPFPCQVVFLASIYPLSPYHHSLFTPPLLEVLPGPHHLFFPLAISPPPPYQVSYFALPCHHTSISLLTTFSRSGPVTAFLSPSISRAQPHPLTLGPCSPHPHPFLVKYSLVDLCLSSQSSCHSPHIPLCRILTSPSASPRPVIPTTLPPSPLLLIPS